MKPWKEYLMLRSSETHSIGCYLLLRLIYDHKAYVMELITDQRLVKYLYTLLLQEKVIVRYDNVLHYPNISTHPHHNHVMNRIEHLEDSSIENSSKK